MPAVLEALQGLSWGDIHSRSGLDRAACRLHSDIQGAVFVSCWSGFGDAAFKDSPVSLQATSPPCFCKEAQWTHWSSKLDLKAAVFLVCCWCPLLIEQTLALISSGGYTALSLWPFCLLPFEQQALTDSDTSTPNFLISRTMSQCTCVCWKLPDTAVQNELTQAYIFILYMVIKPNQNQWRTPNYKRLSW